MRISDVSSDVGSSDLSPKKPNSSLMACWASVAVGSRGKGESFKASSPGGGVDWGVPIVAEGPCGSGPSTGSGQASAASFGSLPCEGRGYGTPDRKRKRLNSST